jgi:hypothetical protein
VIDFCSDPSLASHSAHLVRYLAAGDSLSSDTPIRVNALASGAITAKNESTPLPDKLVSLAHRITAANIGTGWSSWHQAESTSLPESR